MAVSMQQVKELRDLTNAGMLDCKKALEAANGNIDEAMKILKEKGLADAKKRSDRETKEGGVYVGTKDGKVAIALVACETDFVANNAQFKDACNELVGKIIDKGSENADDYKEDLQHIAQITKENVNVKKLKCLNVADNQYVSTYIHGNNQIGVVVVYEMADKAVAEKAEFADMAKNIALHVAANAPMYLIGDDVPEADLAEQKAIFAKQMEGENKPANILENILNGKLSKYKSEICLMEQKYIKDDKMSVKQYVENTSKTLGTEVKVVNFIRFNVGE
ncbi:MAG: translation elongation factor Ts [Spirochaetota bacterium]|jgi:elongation factor Ts|nr:translation elongation factor Ts [Spirochaetota bacterium]